MTKMRLTDEQKIICNVFSLDTGGKVHCGECPMRLSIRGALCLANVTKEEAKRLFNWNGDPYPGLKKGGECEYTINYRTPGASRKRRKAVSRNTERSEGFPG